MTSRIATLHERISLALQYVSSFPARISVLVMRWCQSQGFYSSFYLFYFFILLFFYSFFIIIILFLLLLKGMLKAVEDVGRGVNGGGGGMRGELASR